MPNEPRTTFHWAIYADATLAGLSILIPVPFLDDVSEGYFRGRMTRAIAKVNGVELPEPVVEEISRGEGFLTGCLMLPVKLVVGLIKKLSRKLLYFLTVREASQKLGHYWHRAFLLDYAMNAGHLDSVDSARRSRTAMEQVIESASNPLVQTARQVVGRAGHVWRTVQQTRAEGAKEAVVAGAREEMAERWEGLGGYLREVATRYDERYAALGTPAVR